MGDKLDDRQGEREFVPPGHRLTRLAFRVVRRLGRLRGARGRRVRGRHRVVDRRGGGR